MFDELGFWEVAAKCVAMFYMAVVGFSLFNGLLGFCLIWAVQG